MIFSRLAENRKNAIVGNAGVALNGIDYLEVLGEEAIALGGLPRQTLMIHCLKAAPTTLTADNVMIQGGESITNIGVASIKVQTDPTMLMVTTSVAGDFSPYVLRLVGSAQNAIEDPFEVSEALAGFDPLPHAVSATMAKGAPKTERALEEEKEVTRMAGVG